MKLKTTKCYAVCSRIRVLTRSLKNGKQRGKESSGCVIQLQGDGGPLAQCKCENKSMQFQNFAGRLKKKD